MHPVDKVCAETLAGLIIPNGGITNGGSYAKFGSSCSNYTRALTFV